MGNDEIFIRCLDCGNADPAQFEVVTKEEPPGGAQIRLFAVSIRCNKCGSNNYLGDSGAVLKIKMHNAYPPAR
jgi:hypothetical protein